MKGEKLKVKVKMPIRIIKPNNSARRQMTVLNSELDKNKVEKSLCIGMKNWAGRNNRGRRTVAHRGGGSKKIYRLIDFNQTNHLDKKAKILSLQYDPNRTADIALIEYEDGTKNYILAPSEVKIGAEIVCAEKASQKTGNRMKMKNIQNSSQIYNIEISAGSGGQIARSGGGYAILLGSDGGFCQIKLQSGEIRKISSENYASIGVVSGIDNSKVIIGKAGRVRLSGRRPVVRGKAKNPCDHPHGGGEGRTSIGMTHPKTPWGMPALGHKTRKKNKRSASLILNKRK